MTAHREVMSGYDWLGWTRRGTVFVQCECGKQITSRWHALRDLRWWLHLRRSPKW